MQPDSVMAPLELLNYLPSQPHTFLENKGDAVKANTVTIAQRLQSQSHVSTKLEPQQPRSPRSSAKKNISNDTAKNLKAQQAAQLRLFECSRGSYQLLPDTGVSVFGTA